MRPADREERRIAPRLGRALRRAFARSKEQLSISELATIIAMARSRESVRRRLNAFLRDVNLGPSGAIVRDAFLKGGKIGAKMVPARRR